MQGCAPTPETLTAIRQVADRYAIPADVTGVRLEPGLYHDPGGQPGLRYWDGTHWSPLLPPDVAKPKAVQESPACWPALPMDDRPWTYPAARVKYWTAWFAALAAVSAVLLAAGLVVELWWDRGMHRHASDDGRCAAFTGIRACQNLGCVAHQAGPIRRTSSEARHLSRANCPPSGDARHSSAS